MCKFYTNTVKCAVKPLWKKS